MIKYERRYIEELFQPICRRSLACSCRFGKEEMEEQLNVLKRSGKAELGNEKAGE